ncbi:MAG: MBL fold metallo-hydrolase [Bacilli bacterium]|jgi:glyoxylase-like metal-dependent hydrolase (beta-lactamase superfamily II)|nr:MBL fold metallo-hydrolase [Bacilli bacterium]
MEIKYKIKKIYDNAYRITDFGLGLTKVFLYLLVGSERALLIDSGYGDLDLKKICASITDKEVICACTHGHVDHALGAYQFQKAYLSRKDFIVYQTHSSPENIKRFFYEGIGLKPDEKVTSDPEYKKTVEAMAFSAHRQLLPLDGMPFFDLGDRRVNLIAVPGHTAGGISFIDEKYHVAFDGDGAPNGVWLFLEESSSMTSFKEEMEKYYAYLKAHQIRKRYTGHLPFAVHPRDVRKLALAAQKIIEGKKPLKTISMVGMEASIVFSHGNFIFYNKNHL